MAFGIYFMIHKLDIKSILAVFAPPGLLPAGGGGV
jgi:hypothetical protein